MNRIPLHKLSDKFQGEIAILRHILEDEEFPVADYAHKDDYYVFLFLEKGKGTIAIDFEEYEMEGSTVHCILPGQVHFPVGSIRVCGWILAIDAVLLRNKYKEIFERVSLSESKLQLN